MLFYSAAFGDERLAESVLPILEDRCFDAVKKAG